MHVDLLPNIYFTNKRQVSTLLFGVVPEEFCRDAPPAAAAAGDGDHSISPKRTSEGSPRSPHSRQHQKQQQQQQQEVQQQKQQPSPSKRQRGAPRTIGKGNESGSESGGGRGRAQDETRAQGERSRRRLAAFLEGRFISPAVSTAATVHQGAVSSVKSPKSSGACSIGHGRGGGRSTGGGAMCEESNRCEPPTTDVVAKSLSCRCRSF